MSERNTETNNAENQRSLWAAILVTLFLGTWLVITVYQQATENSRNLIPIICYSLGILATGIAAILSKYRFRNTVPYIIFYAMLLSIFAPSIFIAGRGYLPPIFVTAISTFLIFYIFPKNTRNHPIGVLIIAVSAYLAVEWINPVYRITPPSPTRITPWIAGVFVFVFILLFVFQRWDRLGIRLKATLVTSSLLLVTIGSLTYYAIGSVIHISNTQEEERLDSLYEGYNNYVNTLEQESATLAISIADRQDIVDLYVAKDRQGLLNLLTPLFNTLSRKYNVVHLYIENPDGTVFLRVHNPDLYGDDITYRLTALEALKSLGTETGVDIGPSRMGIRSVTPLNDGARYVGLLEVGIDYDSKFIQDLSDETGADYNIWVTKGAAAPAGLDEPENAPPAPHPDLLFYAGTNQKGAPHIPQNVYQQVLESGEPSTARYVSDGNNDLVVLVAPLIGYGNRIIGVIEIINNRSETLSNIQNATWKIIAVAVIVAVLSVLVFRLFTQSVFMRPISKLLEAATKQSEGDLSIRVQIPGQDEFHQLAGSLNTMTEKVQESISELEVRVAERTMELELSNKDSQHRASQFEAVAKVAQASSTIRELDVLLPSITELISQHFGYYHAGIFMLDGAREYAVLASANSEGGQKMLERKHRLRVGAEGIVGFVTKTGTPRIALNVGEDSVHFNNPDLPDTQSEMALPLKIGTQIIGALDVQSIVANAFSEEDVEVLSTLADQVALAIENARLFGESQRLLKESQIAFGERLQESWAQIATTKVSVGYTLSGSQVKSMEKPLESANIKQAINSGNVVLSENKKTHQLETIAIPIKIREQVVGTLNIQLPTKHHLDTDEIDIAEAIANRVGLAIETATLIEETSRRAAYQRTTSEISEKLSASTRFDAILRTAAEELSRALGGSDVLVQIQPGILENKVE